MKYTKIFRILGIALILSLLMVAIPATPSLAYDRDIELDPDEGEIGDDIEITGEDWRPSYETDEGEFVEKRADIYFAKDEADTYDDIDIDVETYEKVKSDVIGEEGTSDEGEFNTTFEVPDELNDGDDDEDVEPGTYYIYVTDGGYTTIRAVAEFTVIGGGEAEIDPDEGPVGTEVEISGTDFADREDIIIEYDDDEIDIEGGDDRTDSDGEFDTTIIIPESTAGDHTIKVIGDESGSEATATFTVEPEITIDPTEGGIEAAVTVSGTGFDNKSDITVYLDGTEIATDETDSDGSFEATFSVPAVASGTYDVEAYDEDENSATVEFSITATIVNLSLTTGHVDSEVTVSGTGSIAGSTITIKYDDTEVATATAITDGSFSATFKVPSSKYGEHNVTIGDGTTTKQFTFTMESEAPPTPQPLLPQMGVKAEPLAHFDWEDVTDDSLPVTYSLQIATSDDFTANSIVLEKTELAESEYTLTKAEQLEPVGKEEPYFWRIKAIDGASNESQWTGAGTFSVGAGLGLGLDLPTWATYLLLGFGALIIGIIGFWLGRRTAYYSY